MIRIVLNFRIHTLCTQPGAVQNIGTKKDNSAFLDIYMSNSGGVSAAPLVHATAVYSLDVHPQVVLHPEGFLAHGACVRPFPGVHHPMFAERRVGDKTLVAVATLVRPVAHVVAPMLEQRRVGRERLGTGLALKQIYYKRVAVTAPTVSIPVSTYL